MLIRRGEKRRTKLSHLVGHLIGRSGRQEGLSRQSSNRSQRLVDVKYGEFRRVPTSLTPLHDGARHAKNPKSRRRREFDRHVPSDIPSDLNGDRHCNVACGRIIPPSRASHAFRRSVPQHMRIVRTITHRTPLYQDTDVSSAIAASVAFPVEASSWSILGSKLGTLPSGRLSFLLPAPVTRPAPRVGTQAPR